MDIDAKKFMNPGKISQITRSARLADFTDDFELLSKRAFQLFKETEITVEDIRGIGLQIDMLNNGTTEQTSPNKGTSKVAKTEQSPSPTKGSKLFCILSFLFSFLIQFYLEQQKLTSFFAKK